MKFKEFSNTSGEELGVQLRQLRQRHDKLRFQIADGTSKDVRELRVVRRQIAQLLTALRQVQTAAVGDLAQPTPTVPLAAGTTAARPPVQSPAR